MSIESLVCTAEHVIRRTITGADKTNVDFGFSYNVVTNVDGDGSDDDEPGTPGTARLSQGSLHQFILNANAVSGANSMRFVPTEATNASAGGDDWWRISVTQALPQVTRSTP